jgi:DNA-entry nuclease
MKRLTTPLLTLLLALSLLLTGCDAEQIATSSTDHPSSNFTSQIETDATASDATAAESAGNATESGDESAEIVTLDNIPAYSGEPYVAINDNQPYFTASDYTTEAFETYSDLDSLGRCGVAWANICLELMPTEARGEIGQIKPTGWHNAKYDWVDGGYVYNRCHLIGFQLAGENANEKNLITGTRYLNVQGMLPFENLVADYVKETEQHVLYRVTPIFDGDNLLASGVLMEAWSVEDEGDGVCFCVYVYNVQPGVTLDYATGENWATEEDETVPADPDADTSIAGESDATGADATGSSESSGEEEMSYVLNTSSHKFHLPDCSGAASMSASNRQDYTGTRQSLLDQGYTPCGTCKP